MKKNILITFALVSLNIVAGDDSIRANFKLDMPIPAPFIAAINQTTGILQQTDHLIGNLAKTVDNIPTTIQTSITHSFKQFPSYRQVIPHVALSSIGAFTFYQGIRMIKDGTLSAIHADDSAYFQKKTKRSTKTKKPHTESSPAATPASSSMPPSSSSSTPQASTIDPKQRAKMRRRNGLYQLGAGAAFTLAGALLIVYAGPLSSKIAAKG